MKSRSTIATFFMHLLLGCSASGQKQPVISRQSIGWRAQAVELPTGVTLSYFEAGKPGGDVVLFLHGYSDTARSFAPTMERLAQLRPDLHLIALDQRGHGQSTMPSGPECPGNPESCFRPSDFAADAIAFLDAKSIERAVVVGHSLGSIIAQELALSHPARIESIVLISSSSRTTTNAVVRDFILGEVVEGRWKAALEAQGKTFPDDIYNLTPLDADPAAEAWLAANWVTEPAADPAFLAAITRETARIKLGTWLGAARAMLAFDNNARLSQLTVPALVLWGTQDVIFPAEPDQHDLLESLDHASAAPDCQTRYYYKQYGKRPLPESLAADDISHNIQWAIPGAVADDIASYLRSGVPTRDLVYVDSQDLRTIRVESGRAVILDGPKQPCGD